STLDVVRSPRPTSWTMLFQQLEYFQKNDSNFKTLVIDTADWAEMLCAEHVCAKYQKTGIEDIPYGKGWVYVSEEFGKMLNLLSEIGNKMHIVVLAHAAIRKFEQPDEMGAYDRWELKLQKKTAPLLKEWADIVLFANHKTIVVNVDGNGAAKGKNKAKGGKRVMYTQHHPSWDAKNRHDLDEELDFDFRQIAHIFASNAPDHVSTPVPEAPKAPEPAEEQMGFTPAPEATPMEEVFGVPNTVPKALRDLMLTNEVTVAEIQKVVSKKGHFPKDTPIENYPMDYVNGVLVGAWTQVFAAIVDDRDIPFN
ncbi:ATP-binding protein, partial [bacterium]